MASGYSTEFHPNRVVISFISNSIRRNLDAVTMFSKLQFNDLFHSIHRPVISLTPALFDTFISKFDSVKTNAHHQNNTTSPPPNPNTITIISDDQQMCHFQSCVFYLFDLRPISMPHNPKHILIHSLILIPSIKPLKNLNSVTYSFSW